MGDRRAECQYAIARSIRPRLPGHFPTFAWTLDLFVIAILVIGSATAFAAPSARHDEPAGAKAGDALDDDTEADDEDEDDEDEEDGVTQYLQELFLGFAVYPQEKDEVQFTWGLFNGAEVGERSLAFFEMDYGITDRLQIGFELPYEFGGDELLFVVAYQDFGGWAVNFSAALEIEDFRDRGEDTESVGELALAVFGPVGPFVPILELGLEIAAEETPLRIAPGL